MSRHGTYPPGVPCWVQAVHPDPAAMVPFYEAVFGWETENLMPADHAGDYFLCRLRGHDVAAIVSQHGGPPPPGPVWATHVCVESAGEAAARARAAGGRVLGEPFDSPGGGRQAVLADPSGAVLCAWEPRERAGAQLVNEPGAWSMSALLTPAPDASASFYRDVFGWETETFELGGAAVTLWKLPGYVGGEPQQPVARDVVATMLPAEGDVAPAWTVDFWIGDLDGAARTVRELGGGVITEPYDVPGVGMRQAVIADPAGAVLTLTQPPGLA